MFQTFKRSGMGKGNNLNRLESDLDMAMNLFNVRICLLSNIELTKRNKILIDLSCSLFQTKRDKKMDRSRNLNNLQSSLDDVQNLFLKRSGIGQGGNLENLQNELTDAFNLFNVSQRKEI